MFGNITRLLQISQTAMLAQTRSMDVISSNLSNSNTVGFKSSRANFQQVLENSRSGGVLIQATQRAITQGPLRATNNPLDIAIDGEGFFAVTLPDGKTAYTRDGQFTVDSSNQIVTSGGYPLVWTGNLPAAFDDLHVNPDGSVMASQNGIWNQAGSIDLVDFTNPLGLDGFGHNLWLESDVSGAPAVNTPMSNGLGLLVGNAVENSNVNLSEEMTHLVSLQRAFQMSVRAFEYSDHMYSQAINMRQG